VGHNQKVATLRRTQRGEQVEAGQKILSSMVRSPSHPIMRVGPGCFVVASKGVGQRGVVSSDGYNLRKPAVDDALHRRTPLRLCPSFGAAGEAEPEICQKQG